MTVIVWDGTTLAADKRAVCGDRPATTTKIWKHKNELMGGAGTATTCLMMRDWYVGGRDPKKFPEPQKQEETSCNFVVVRRDGSYLRFEGSHVPLELSESHFAMGTGADYAYGAIAMGADAIKAVEVASQYDLWCGNGVDTLTFDEVR